MRWSEASRARRAVELDKIGTTTQFVLLDLRDAAKNLPALQDELERCKSKDERELLAFEWFEDHPQPIERSNWIGSEGGGPVIFSLGDPSPPTFRTPDWPGGRLPRLEDDRRAETPPVADKLVGGFPYLKDDYLAAGKLHKAGKMTVDGIERRRRLSTRRAHRIHRQLTQGAVISDGVGLRPGRGYQWDPAWLDAEPRKYRLIRS